MESVDTINERLTRLFGRFEGQSRWRVVFSDDQFEKRLTHNTDEGFDLLSPEVRELPKYRQWIHHKYILENLLPVPDMQRHELTTKLSYEPVWVFEDGHGNPLPPKWEVIQIVIDTVYQNAAKAVGVKYKDPESSLEESIEDQEKRIKLLQETLYGNETEVGDALAHNEAIIVPKNYGTPN